MCNRPPAYLDCSVCTEPIPSDQVLVYADPTGRDNLATSPYHLRCYLTCLDPALPSNRPLTDFVAEQASSIIRNFYDHQT